MNATNVEPTLTAPADTCTENLLIAEQRYTCVMPADHAKYDLKHKTKIRCIPSAATSYEFDIVMSWDTNGLPAIGTPIEPVTPHESVFVPEARSRPWWKLWGL